MPKKTKKQKLLADLHRKSHTIQLNNESSSARQETTLVNKQNIERLSSQLETKSPTFVYQKDIVTKPKNISTASNYSYISADLLKITIFTFLALVFQGVVYFLLRTK